MPPPSIREQTIPTRHEDWAISLHRFASAFAVSAEGFDAIVADSTHWPALRRFGLVAVDRQRASTELRQIARQYGPRPQAAGLWLSGHQRNWLAVRTVLSSRDQESLWREIEKAELYLLHGCEDAQESMTDGVLHDVLALHTASIQQVLESITER